MGQGVGGGRRGGGGGAGGGRGRLGVRGWKACTGYLTSSSHQLNNYHNTYILKCKAFTLVCGRDLEIEMLLTCKRDQGFSMNKTLY